VISKRWLKTLLAIALLLPAAILVLLGMERLLAVLGDASAAKFFQRLGRVCTPVWVFDLLGLLLAVAAKLTCERDQ